MNKSPRKTKVGAESSIVDGSIYFEDVRQCALDSELGIELLDDRHQTAIRVISLSSGWYQKFKIAGVEVKENINLEMTLRKERRGTLDHWYAYRQVFGKLHKRYVGTSDRITEARLVAVAQRLPSL